ncbi:hypothetical protein LVD17_02845 [Fulvivirga ulvae]|uniref:DUF6702 family protein n=1 Tax=Fulvivirga ulvae TaxID=2904245 RepID=UPI001F422F28|nr:DUF6702 family protein [Fulvivirga ulvae]UII32769.1 hypothetical protein LVD17_02845 [Fulvivirga ulvae]
MKVILMLSVFILTSFMHPLKMSFSSMSVSNEGKVKIETRLFLDDLTLHIEDRYRLKDADFSTPAANGSIALQQYIRENIHILQAGDTIYFIITGISLSEDGQALVVEMESAGALDKKQSYKVKNSLLFDIFKKQKNLLIIKGKEYYKFYFTIDDPVQEVN